MNHAEVRAWLDGEWEKVLERQSHESDPEIDCFTNSNSVAIRYAFVTQLLGKIADSRRSLLYIQSGTSDVGAWNARSFSSAVVVPWVEDNHGVLGTSSDPYVSKPLRRVRLNHDMTNVKNKEEWQSMVTPFTSLEEEGMEAVEDVFSRCLRSLARKLAQQRFKYQIPRRISLEALGGMVESFLSETSQGLRPLAVSTALMRILGRAFSIFPEVKSQGLNEADSASGMPGDIVCYDRQGEISLVLEVKDYSLRVIDFQTSVRKVRESGNRLSNLLFVVPGIRELDMEEIETKTQHVWATGLNIYRVDIGHLVKMAFVLLDEEWRVVFMKDIGEELDRRGQHMHRRAWHDLLSDLGERS